MQQHLMGWESFEKKVASMIKNPETKKFYEAHPYPSQKIESASDLHARKHEEIMERILFCLDTDKKEIGNKTLLDAGCGTGEKSLYFAMLGAKSTGFDISKSSIGIARANAKKLGLDAKFIVDSFEDFNMEGKEIHGMEEKQKQGMKGNRLHGMGNNGKYDFVICIGSLHHSADPKGNFMRMASLVKPGGSMCAGLYHKCGRVRTKIKRMLLWHGESDFEKVIAKTGIWEGAPKTAYANVADRLASPRESYHTIGEVKSWFEDAGFNGMKTYPEANLDSKKDVFMKELEWLAGSMGFFFMGGKKKA